MARYIIADITDARVVTHELTAIYYENRSLPVIPIILKAEKQRPIATFEEFQEGSNFLPLHSYSSLEALIETFEENVFGPAEQKVRELRAK
jgi:hypothetical protein